MTVLVERLNCLHVEIPDLMWIFPPTLSNCLAENKFFLSPGGIILISGRIASSSGTCEPAVESCCKYARKVLICLQTLSLSFIFKVELGFLQQFVQRKVLLV